MPLTHEHLGIQKNLQRFFDAVTHPHVEAWEATGVFPAHEVFKKMGLLSLNKPEILGLFERKSP